MSHEMLQAQLETQLRDIEMWKKQEEEKIRDIVRNLIIGFCLIVIGFAGAIMRIQHVADQAKETAVQVQSVARTNSRLISQLNSINMKLAEDAYQECLTRNTRIRQDIQDQRGLVRAHTRDGSSFAARQWTTYLHKREQTKLPPCKDPSP